MIVFLDIDGVLNGIQWAECRPPRGFIPPETAQQAFDEERIDPRCVEGKEVWLCRDLVRTGGVEALQQERVAFTTNTCCRRLRE